MSWTKSSVGNGWCKATETITTVQDQSTAHYTSEIDFLPPDKDFLVLATANDLSDSGHLDMYVAASSGGTFASLKASFMCSLDNNTKAKWYDVSSYGIGPYAKIAFAPDGAQDASDTIAVTIMYEHE